MQGNESWLKRYENLSVDASSSNSNVLKYVYTGNEYKSRVKRALHGGTACSFHSAARPANARSVVLSHPRNSRRASRADRLLRALEPPDKSTHTRDARATRLLFHHVNSYIPSRCNTPSNKRTERCFFLSK